MTAMTAQRYGRYDPWADLASRAGVDLDWHQPGKRGKWEDPMGLTAFSSLRVTLLLGMDEHQLRTTLAHELVHLERGPVGLRWANKTEAAEEARVHLIAAQRLIVPADYEAWLAGRQDPTKITPTEARAFCRVDGKTLRTYRNWRKRVKPETADRAHAEAAAPVAWPPAWITENVDMYEEAARFTGVV